jgi:aspartokinase
MFGPHFGERPGIAGVMFSALASVGINILAISTSISSISCLIDVDDMDEAIQVLEETFELP